MAIVKFTHLSQIGQKMLKMLKNELILEVFHSLMIIVETAAE